MEVTVHQALPDFATIPAVLPIGLNGGNIKTAGLGHSFCEVMTESGDIVVSFWRYTQVCIWWIVDILGQNKLGLAVKTRHNTW